MRFPQHKGWKSRAKAKPASSAPAGVVLAWCSWPDARSDHWFPRSLLRVENSRTLNCTRSRRHPSRASRSAPSPTTGKRKWDLRRVTCIHGVFQVECSSIRLPNCRSSACRAPPLDKVHGLFLRAQEKAFKSWSTKLWTRSGLTASSGPLVASDTRSPTRHFCASAQAIQHQPHDNRIPGSVASHSRVCLDIRGTTPGDTLSLAAHAATREYITLSARPYKRITLVQGSDARATVRLVAHGRSPAARSHRSQAARGQRGQ